MRICLQKKTLGSRDRSYLIPKNNSALTGLREQIVYLRTVPENQDRSKSTPSLNSPLVLDLQCARKKQKLADGGNNSLMNRLSLFDFQLCMTSLLHPR